VSAGNYITIDDLVLYGYQIDLDKDGPLLEKLIPRATVTFEGLAGMPAGYFNKAADEASPKEIFGTGGTILSVPPYVGDEIIVGSMPTGYTIPTFAASGGVLRLTDSGGVMIPVAIGIGWPQGLKITVVARWGFEEVPEDVKQAVIELAMAMFRSKDQAASKAINLDSRQITFYDAIPARTKMIARKYRNSRIGAEFV
jgi:hypothetical protein